jgi:CRP-like cAMP-binding protein
MKRGRACARLQDPTSYANLGAVTISERGRQAFRTAVERFTPMHATDLEVLLKFAKERALAQGGFFLRQGDIAQEVAVIVTGVVREYYTLADGRERTRAFAREGEMVGSLADLLLQGPAMSSSVAATRVELVVVPWARVRQARDEHPRWKEFSFRMLEGLYLRKARREYELLALDASKRYEAFLETFPGLDDRVKQIDVASYLAITPEHLSRLRRARRNSGDMD